MRAVIQRVSYASVTVDEQRIAAIQQGLLVLVGVDRADTAAEGYWLADKIAHLRIFSDDQGKMNHSVLDVAGEVLVVSQFTLSGQCEHGRRPDFTQAARPEIANTLYLRFVEDLRSLGVPVQTGKFQAHMQVELLNDGPVTIWMDSSTSRGNK